MPYPEHYFKSGCYGHHSIPILLDGQHVIKGLYRGAAVPAYPIPIQSSLGKLRSCIEIVPIGLYFRNSVVVSLCVLVLQYLIIVPAAYSFARHEYFGKNIFFGIVLLGLMIPQQITFLPVYLMFSRMKMLKTFIPLILPFISNPFGIFMLRQYFMQIPQEVIEAARLDDADNRKIMFKVMMPMAKPALITIGLLSFISTWNNYFWPLIMTSSETLRTLPVGIAALKSSETLQMWHIIMAGNVVLVLPILIVYMLASQKIRNSFVYSGIK